MPRIFEYALGRHTLSGLTPPGQVGRDPKSVPGVDFFDGEKHIGMIVFKTPGIYYLPSFTTGKVEVLVVAGGGGGGQDSGGAAGGGAGGLKYEDELQLEETLYTIQVGDGGAGNDTTNDSQQGESSLALGISATGGGRGGGNSADGSRTGGSGGSGGGAAGSSSSGGSGIAGQGHDGGTGASSGTGAAGGGGAGSAGGNGATGDIGGDPGNGSTYFGKVYAKGGAGAGFNEVGGDNSFGQDGEGNTGEGGTGNRAEIGSGGTGGKGIVIIRWGGYEKNYDPENDSVS